MTEKERMEAGLLYDPGKPEFLEKQAVLNENLHKFNMLLPSQREEQQKYMKEVFAECGDNVFIQRPFYANWGGHHVHLGSNVYANFGVTFVDDTHIYIGSGTMLAPNVIIATAGHPIDPELRSRALQYNMPVRIGNNCWLGAGVIVMPGVTIGDNTVIGAGSVVTKDIPSGVVAVGNPCRVIREVGEHDREFYFRDRRIDPEIFEKK